jgi:rhodanese-related sulfurtransferase
MTASPLHADMAMADLLAAWPGAQRALFRKYHIGGCSACGFRPEETLAQVCLRNDNIPPDEALAWLAQSREEEARMEISPAELRDSLVREAETRVLDIRTREEFETAHLPGSQLFTQDLLQTALGTWSKDAPIVVLDHQGLRAADAAAYFAGHGFSAVRHLRGGLDAYSVEADATIPRYTCD